MKKNRFAKKENARSQICVRFVRLQENWCCTLEQAGISNIMFLIVSDQMNHRTHINTETHANNYSFTPYNLLT